MNKVYLFPYKYKYTGLVLILLGLGSGYLYYFGGKPVFFTAPVFAIITSYLETRIFTMAETNLLDEIASVFCIAGLVMISFSKEKSETEKFNLIRLRAITLAVYITVALWIVILLTVFGWPIFIVSTSIFPVFLIIYLITFRIMVLKSKKGNNNTFSENENINI